MSQTPFLIERRPCRPATLHLLPTANVVVVLRGRAPVLIQLPHGDVREADDPEACVSLAPNVIKCLLDEPRRFLGQTLTPSSHPMLQPLADCRTVPQLEVLLVDLRSSLAVTPDERDFLDLWCGYCEEPDRLPTSDRWVQRLCLRYAGQPPRRLRTLARLARTLAAADERVLHNGLGHFADASHFARVCRSFTGRAPSAWRNLSQPFC